MTHMCTYMHTRALSRSDAMGCSLGVTVYLDLARVLPQPGRWGPGCMHVVVGAVAARAVVSLREDGSNIGTIQHISHLAADVRSHEIFTEACSFRSRVIEHSRWSCPGGSPNMQNMQPGRRPGVTCVCQSSLAFLGPPF